MGILGQQKRENEQKSCGNGRTCGVGKGLCKSGLVKRVHYLEILKNTQIAEEQGYHRPQKHYIYEKR